MPSVIDTQKQQAKNLQNEESGESAEMPSEALKNLLGDIKNLLNEGLHRSP